MEINKIEKIIKNVNELINSLNGDVVELITFSALLENALKNSKEKSSTIVEDEKKINTLLEKADDIIKKYSINNFNK